MRSRATLLATLALLVAAVLGSTACKGVRSAAGRASTGAPAYRPPAARLPEDVAAAAPLAAPADGGPEARAETPTAVIPVAPPAPPTAEGDGSGNAVPHAESPPPTERAVAAEPQVSPPAPVGKAADPTGDLPPPPPPPPLPDPSTPEGRVALVDGATAPSPSPPPPAPADVPSEPPRVPAPEATHPVEPPVVPTPTPTVVPPRPAIVEGPPPSVAPLYEPPPPAPPPPAVVGSPDGDEPSTRPSVAPGGSLVPPAPRGVVVAREPAAPAKAPDVDPDLPSTPVVPPPPAPKGAVVPPPTPAPSAPTDLGSPDGDAAAPAAPPRPPDVTPSVTAPTGASRDVPSFGESRAKKVERHVAALKETGTSVPCWPKDLVQAAPASVALADGARPVLILFFDDTSTASRLGAADLWPVVLDWDAKVDVVYVDVTPGRKTTRDEDALVRRYYLGYVPATVLLASERKSVLLLKNLRVEASLLREKLADAR